MTGLVLISASVLASSVRGKLGDTSIVVGRVAPVLAIACFIVILWYIVSNYGMIVGSDSPVVNFAPIILIIGGVAAAVVESRNVARGVGEVSLDEGA